MKNQIQPTKEGAMKRRIVIALALIAVLVVGSSMIGGTLAYLSTYTPEIENVFTLGELNYQLTYVANPPDGFVDNDVLDMPVPNPAKFTIAASEHTFESTAPVLTGHKFLGWADSEDATTPDYPYNEETGKCLVTVEYDPETFKVDGALTEKTVFAVWKQMDFMLSFDTQVDEVPNPQDKTVTYQLPYGELPTVERTGYTFLNWALDKEGTKPITAESIVNIAKDHTAYAQWEAKTYYIRYYANGGEGFMPSQKMEYDKLTTLSKNLFTKDDYTFAGWSTTPDGEVEYLDEQNVVNLLEGGFLDLYAVWIQESHTVYFDYNGGSGSPASKQFQNGKAYGTLPEYPVHPTVKFTDSEGKEKIMNYLFTGWYTERDGGTRVYPLDTVKSTEDHTLYAHWEEAPTNNVILNMTVKNNPDDDKDGVVDDFNLTFTCTSSFEKFNVPIKNLIPGQQYELTFTASNNASYGDYVDGYKNSVYASYIVSDPGLTGGLIKNAVAEDIIRTWNDRIEPDGNNDGSQAAINDADLQGPHNRTIRFTATHSTMYWAWDFGLMQDNIPNEYNFRNISLKPIVPTIEFANKKLKIHETSKAQTLNDTSSAYATSFVFDGDGYAETMYYPITGLTAGSTYTITFDHTFSGKLIDDSVETPRYHYGCGIMNAEPTVYGSHMKDIGSWASDTFVMESVTGKTESVALTFKATGSTAYWVWNMANVSDTNDATIDVKVTNFSATHSGGGITYYTAPSQANAIGYTMTPPAFEPITVDMPGITVTGMETYATDQPLVLTLNGDADIMPDLVLVDVLVGENWTFYATGFDKDLLASYAAADGVTIAQEEWLAKNEDGSWTLTIPGEVVVSDVTIVIYGANFWSYDLYDMTIDDLNN